MNFQKMLLAGMIAVCLLGFRETDNKTSYKRFFHRQLGGQVSYRGCQINL